MATNKKNGARRGVNAARKGKGSADRAANRAAATKLVHSLAQSLQLAALLFNRNPAFVEAVADELHRIESAGDETVGEAVRSVSRGG